MRVLENSEFSCNFAATKNRLQAKIRVLPIKIIYYANN
jgi:hypothetical protein